MSKEKDKKHQAAGKAKGADAPPKPEPAPPPEAQTSAGVAVADGRPERCPECGAPTEPIMDFRLDAPAADAPIPGAWGCGTEGCPSYGGHFPGTEEETAGAGDGPLPPESEGAAGPDAVDQDAGANEDLDDEDLDEGDGDDPDEAPRLTVEELREMGCIAAESGDRGGFIDVVTKGGRKLRFPGDEERAAALTLPELTGEPLKAPDVASGTLQPRTLRDLQELGCIAAQRYDEATRQTVVVTKGGRKLRFPGDEALAGQLTDSELDGVARKAWPRVNEKSSLLGKPIKR